jgi:hypothetical protein
VINFKLNKYRIIAILIFISMNSGCYLHNQVRKNTIIYNSEDWHKDSLLVKHFLKLDSIISHNNYGKSFYCPNVTLKYIVDKTAIPSTGDNTFIGGKFTIDDWINWHNWFKNKFRSTN